MTCEDLRGYLLVRIRWESVFIKPIVVWILLFGGSWEFMQRPGKRSEDHNKSVAYLKLAGIKQKLKAISRNIDELRGIDEVILKKLKENCGNVSKKVKSEDIDELDAEYHRNDIEKREQSLLQTMLIYSRLKSIMDQAERKHSASLFTLLWKDYARRTKNNIRIHLQDVSKIQVRSWNKKRSNKNDDHNGDRMFP